MNYFFKTSIKFIKISILSIFIFVLASPLTTNAAFTAYFGGHLTIPIPCTCTAGSVMWAYTAPLYYSLTAAGPIIGPIIGPVTYLTESPLIYSNYYLGTFVWGLGDFEPETVPLCYIGVEPYCYTLKSYGLILPASGDSPPTVGGA